MQYRANLPGIARPQRIRLTHPISGAELNFHVTPKQTLRILMCGWAAGIELPMCRALTGRFEP